MMAQHEALQTRVPVTVGANRKMVFSLGLGLRGTGGGTCGRSTGRGRTRPVRDRRRR